MTTSYEFPNPKKIYNEICPPEVRKQALNEYDEMLNELFHSCSYLEKTEILREIGWNISLDGDTRAPSEIWNKEDRKSKVEALRKFGFTDLKEVD